MAPPFFLRRSRAVILQLLLCPLALLPVALPPSAQATGFMTSGPFEVQEADRCAGKDAVGCIDVIADDAMDLWSDEVVGDTLSWTSAQVSSPYIVSFVLSFTREAGSYGFYKISGGAENIITSGSNTYLVDLNINDTLTFGVANANSGFSQTLSVSAFNATPSNDNNDPAAVPAPLPLLGAGAAFGIIRRRRARLRAAAQAQ